MMKVFRLVAFFLCVCVLFLTGCSVLSGEASSSVSESDATLKSQYDNAYEYVLVDDAVKIVSHHYNEEKSIVIPEQIDGKSVEILANNAFYQHKMVTTFRLPDTLKRIESGAFYRCYSLEKIDIPANVSEIEQNPFFRCSSLTTICVEEDNQYYTAVDGILYTADKSVLVAYPEGKEDERYVVPDTIKAFGEECFGYSTKLRYISIPSSVIDFPDYNLFVFPDKITLMVEKGSAAEQYAEDFDIPYEICDD